jgi:hypothetical protein
MQLTGYVEALRAIIEEMKESKDWENSFELESLFLSCKEKKDNFEESIAAWQDSIMDMEEF